MKKLLIIICSIPGVGLLTAVTVLAETNGFDLIRNKKQLTSYAGLDVREKQSGTSVKGKPKISKKGNRYLRKAMHFPALTAIRHDERFKAIFARMVAKHGIKMKAAVAIQRKLLEMIFTIYKSKIAYDKEYFKKLESRPKPLSKQAGLSRLKNKNIKYPLVFNTESSAFCPLLSNYRTLFIVP
ncbi:MAG: IS110 family transposase [Chitinophagaceae bacterium]